MLQRYLVRLQVYAQRIAVRGLPKRKIKELFFLCQGAKKIIFYSLPFGQAEASIY